MDVVGFFPFFGVSSSCFWTMNSEMASPAKVQYTNGIVLEEQTHFIVFWQWEATAMFTHGMRHSLNAAGWFTKQSNLLQHFSIT